MNDEELDDERLPVLEVGLVMAGAVSAGAYTAGVADFLIQALDAWEDARADNDPLAPRHRLRLSSMAGASAGAMTAAIVAGIVSGRRHRPVIAADPGSALDDNALFESWVNRIDAERLLDTGDLRDTDRRVLSLLNGDALETIARDAIPAGAGGHRRTWIADELRLALSITNLRGVPYNLGFGESSDAPQPRPGHSMRMHADLMRFRLAAGRPPSHADLIELDTELSGEGWATLRTTALASGAFPLLLPPKHLRRSADDYAARMWPRPRPGRSDSADDCLLYMPLPPHWGAGPPPSPFEFLAADGGVLDNQPFAAARDLLVGVPPQAPAGNVVARTLITISPFPDLVGFRPGEPQPGGMLDIALRLLAAMRNQTRFQPNELVTAADHPYAARQLIAPSRRVDGERMDHPLAGGAVDGFAGFLERDFRLHDFQLGRSNCQRYLRLHYRLPADHRLFSAWTPDQRGAFDDGTGTLPVLPLLGTAAEPNAMPPWPRLPATRMPQLRQLLQRRTKALLPHAINHLLARSSAPMRWLTRTMARFQSRGWVRALSDHIERELRQRGQL